MTRLPTLNVGLLLYPGVEVLDFAGPYEVFTTASRMALRQQPEAVSSVGLQLCGLEPLPERFERPTWTVLLGRPGEAAQVLRRQPAWLATRQWLSQQLQPLLAGTPPQALAPAQVPARAAPPVEGLPAAAGAVGAAQRAARGAAQHAAQHAASAPTHRLLTVCVGALLAADAGLLAHHRCTTHHELLADLARIAPTAQVLPNRLWVEDGALLSSAGITAGIDLALHLIDRHCGPALAANVAQVMVAAGRRGAAAPQLSPLLAWRDHLHPAVHRVQEAIAEAPGQAWSAQALAAVAHVTPRHLARLFRQHTGLSPRGYVEQVRLALAQAARQRGARGSQAAALAGFTTDRQWRRARQRQSGTG